MIFQNKLPDEKARKDNFFWEKEGWGRGFKWWFIAAYFFKKNIKKEYV
ncbi:MAG: hypothetical protein ACJAT4_001867 [Granulosicoccus sp.]